MTAEEVKAFEEKIRAYIGREVEPARRGYDDVNCAMIRHWAEVTGDANPVYTDEEFARSSSKQGLIAPPAMMQTWGMIGYPMARPRRPEERDVQQELHALFDEHGFTGVLGTNSRSEYFRELRPGDQVTVHTVFDSISEQKATARGIGYFIETVTSFSDQHGEAVGRLTFRVLKFIPADQSAGGDQPEDETAPKAATRIASPRGHDNQWWWEAVDKGTVLIQRCKDCQTLRHPPRPMCGECQSTEWDHIESSLDGEVLSFTELHYPKFPGYPAPLICAVIQLAEGTNLVANIVGCDPEQVAIGMKVKGRVEQVDDSTMLPQFYPAG